MRTKWVKRRLGNAVQVNPKADPLPAEFVYIDLESVKDGELQQRKVISRTEAPSRAQRTLRTGDVLFQLVRPYQQNNLFFAPQDDADYVASTGYGQIRTEQESRYFYYSLHRTDFLNRVLALCTGTGYPAIAPSELSKIVVSYPSSIDEQRRIAGILSTCDEVITRSRAAVEKLRKIKAGMLNDFFTRGIADDGRLRPPPQQAPKLYKDSPLGPIPKEWEVETVDECFDLLRNNTLSRAMLIEQPGRIYNVHYGDVLVKYETIVDCARDRLPSLRADVSLGSSVDYAQEGDLVFADTAEDDTVGKAVELVNVGDLKVVAGLHTIFMRSKTRRFASRWLGYFVNSAAFHSQLLPFVAGSKVSSISRGNIKRVSVLIPSGEEQCRVVERMASIDEEIRREEDLIAKYRSVKAGLMQRLLSPPTDAEVVDETIREAV